MYDVYVWRPHVNVSSRARDNNNAEGNNNASSVQVKPAVEQFQLLMHDNGKSSAKMDNKLLVQT
jgi:hypothetical protein